MPLFNVLWAVVGSAGGWVVETVSSAYVGLGGIGTATAQGLQALGKAVGL